MTAPTAARDRETMPTVSGGQHWLVSWHPADDVPEGSKPVPPELRPPMTHSTNPGVRKPPRPDQQANLCAPRPLQNSL